MITEKLINKFLVYLYQNHILIHGESLSSLHKEGVLLLDKEFSNKHPEAIVNIDKNGIRDLTFHLGKELETRGFATVDNLYVFLTPKGYEKAGQLLHPIKHFMVSHWKWHVGAVFTLITISLAIIKLTECQ